MAKRRETKTIKPKSLTAGFAGIEGKKKSDKEQRTLFLKKEPFERFQKICREEGKVVAHVFDGWIIDFLKEYEQK